MVVAQSDSSDFACGRISDITLAVADVTAAIACTVPQDQRTSIEFCKLIDKLSYTSPGCDIILHAGGIPIMFHCWRSYFFTPPPLDGDVVHALRDLTTKGSEAVKSAIRSEPNCEELLRTISQAHYSYRRDAEEALRQLGYRVCCCTIM